VYASLILHDDKVPITSENIQKLITAASVTVEPYWPKLFASLLEGRDVGSLLLAAGGGGGGGGGAAGGAAPAAGGAAGGDKKDAKKEDEKKKEKEKSEESGGDMGFSLFD